MISAQSAITKARRDLALGAFLKAALVGAGAVALGMGMLSDTGTPGLAILTVVVFIGVFLSIRSARGSRMAADSPTLIAAGQFELAEAQIGQALESFSIFRTVKLMSLHHLALLRHAQGCWQDCATLCRALLRQRLGPARGLDRSTRLILAESLLEMGDLAGTWDSLRGLYDQRLTLPQALNLLSVQLDYESRLGAWEQMMRGTPTKVQLAELMPARQSARTQALLALAAKKTGRSDWFGWLRRRAELLNDPQKIIADRPILAEVFAPA